MRRSAHVLLLASALMLTGGCGEEVNPQANLLGNWTLESRRLPGGQVLRPPQANGWLEWFQMDTNRAHVTVAFSAGENQVQFLGAHYTLTGGAFSREVYLQIGGGYRTDVPAGQAYETARTSDGGQIAVRDGRTTLTHADGTAMAFEGTTLTIAHKDGTVDTWKKVG